MKMTLPTAFTVSMLAWGLISFPAGYSKAAGATSSAQDQVVWGADYLLKTVIPTSGGGISLIYQVKVRCRLQSFCTKNSTLRTYVTMLLSDFRPTLMYPPPNGKTYIAHDLAS